MKKYQVMYYAGAAISLLVGLWHFTVPWMFGWASYIPYETLVVPINYVNLCFSFLLSGLSLTVILWGKMVFAIVMLHLQILQEERYLEETFGEAYREYKRHTFRYLGRR